MSFSIEAQILEDKVNLLVQQMTDVMARLDALENTTPPIFPVYIQGYAEKVTGGTVPYVVTNLNDNGPGSLRDALSQSDRYITFDVDGTIKLESQLLCNSSNITLDGSNHNVVIEGNGYDHVFRIAHCSNVLVKNLKFQGKKIEGGNERDVLSIENCSLLAFDHCVFRWGTDENIGLKLSDDVTFQWCMIYETLLPHSTGFLIREGTTRINIHHCLFAHNRQRNPQYGVFEGSEDSVFDLRNNIVYNDGVGGRRAAIEFKKLGTINVIKNYYKKGLDGQKDFAMVVEDGGKIYLEGNYLANVPTWLDPALDKQGEHVNSPVDVPSIETQDPLDAYDLIMNNVGTDNPDVDDLRILDDIKNGTGRIK